MRSSLMNEFKLLPKLASLPIPNGTLSVSLLIPARNAGADLSETVAQAHGYLTARFGEDFEIILIPNPAPGNTNDHSIEIAEKLAKDHSHVRSVPHLGPPGKGAALRTGVVASLGKSIYFTDADLPYDLNFFDDAKEILGNGVDLVTGNRRLPSSHFDVPVSLLPLAYRRHRLGLAFNRVVRLIFPITTTDTQAGIKAMSRRLALRAFSLQTCPGFFFDLEIFLTCRGSGFRNAELPVTLYLNSEKSTVRIFKEAILAGFWLARLAFRSLQKKYGPGRRSPNILSRYPRTGFLTRLFLSARWRLTPYSRMARELPEHGSILDMGCGHGLFTLALAMQSSDRQVVGFDHDPARIELAREASRDLPNIVVTAGNMSTPPDGQYTGIAMIDVMHYFDPQAQSNLAKTAFRQLQGGGRLIVREVNPEGGAASRFNRFYEKVATGIGFTRAEKKGLHFRTREGWEELFRDQGFEVQSKPCSSFLFADILYVCERPSDHPTPSA